MVLGKNIAHDMKSGAEGAHFFGALLLTFSFDKHISPCDSILSVDCAGTTLLLVFSSLEISDSQAIKVSMITVVNIRLQIFLILLLL